MVWIQVLEAAMIDHYSKFNSKHRPKHRNIKTQGITTGETSFVKLNGFYLFR